MLNGWTEQTDPVTGGTYLFPILGPQIGPVNTEGNVPAPDDVRTEVARDLEMVYQDEFILGFQQAINQAWSYGVNATYRKVNSAVEDMRINHIAGCPRILGSFPIINPGEVDDPVVRGHRASWVTIDSSEDGYVAIGQRR